MGTLKPLSGVIKLTLPIETPVIHVQGGFKVPMETGRNLEHTTERHQRGFKVPMETGSMLSIRVKTYYVTAPCMLFAKKRNGTHRVANTTMLL